jgi:hypothetical protein
MNSLYASSATCRGEKSQKLNAYDLKHLLGLVCGHREFKGDLLDNWSLGWASIPKRRHSQLRKLCWKQKVAKIFSQIEWMHIMNDEYISWH